MCPKASTRREKRKAMAIANIFKQTQKEQNNGYDKNG